MLVALDTSTRFAGLALAENGNIVAELNWEVGQRHSTELLERLEWLLKLHDIQPGELTGIAVATGPGSFNGVRVAVTAAKALALAWEIPIYAHCTLDCIAWGAAFSDRTVWAILDAGRGQVYAARYRTPAHSAADWHPEDGYHVLTPAELASRFDQPTLICGEWLPVTQTTLEHTAQDVRFASKFASRRAGWLAELALARASTGSHADPATVEPLYLRKPAITRSSKPGLERKETGGAIDHSHPGESMQSMRSARQGEGTPHALRS